MKVGGTGETVYYGYVTILKSGNLPSTAKVFQESAPQELTGVCATGTELSSEGRISDELR